MSAQVRVKQGYGARWTVSEDGSAKFRGLENAPVVAVK